MKKSRSTLDLWQRAQMFLPENLDEIAVKTGALKRPRRVSEALQMLRAFLVYADCGSFRTAAALTSKSGLLSITSEGLFYRLSHSEAFLERVLADLVGLTLAAPIGYRVLLVDATVVTGPGSKGTDWRVHVAYDPCRGLPCSVEVSDQSVGEHLRLHPLGPGQIVLGDRGYGTASNVDEAIRAGADVLIRISTNTIRLLGDSGRINLTELSSQVPEVGAVCFQVRMPTSGGSEHPVRLVAARNNRSEVVWLLTTASQDRLSPAQACELYRSRWQIELYFKRLKSLGDLDVQRSREGPTARASLLAKMILLVLTSLLQDEEQSFSPYGYPFRSSRAKPVARIHGGSQAARGLDPAPPPPVDRTLVLSPL